MLQPSGAQVRQFYDESWRQVEVRNRTSPTGTDAIGHTFYGKRHIDDVVAHRVDTGTLGSHSDDTTYWHVTDGQFSTRAIVKPSGSSTTSILVERIDYDAYGMARHHYPGDTDGDGDYDVNDYNTIYGLSSVGIGAGTYNAEADLNRDGVIDSTDVTLAGGTSYKTALAFGVLTGSAGNNFGFGGYVYNAGTGYYLVRNRWYDPGTGRWIQRDPAGYVDGLNLYEYCQGGPWDGLDPMGLDDDAPPEEYIYLPGRDRVYVIRYTNSRSLGSAAINTVTFGYVDPGTTRVQRELTVYMYDNGAYMPNGMTAEAYLVYKRRQKALGGESADQAHLVTAYRNVVATGTEEVKQALQDRMIDAVIASGPVGVIASRKALMEAAEEAAAAEARLRRGFRADLEEHLGRTLGRNERAHHIVALTDCRAEAARARMAKFGLDVADAKINGMPVPKKLHAKLNSDAYYAHLNAGLKRAKNRKEAEAFISSMRESIGKARKVEDLPWERGRTKK